VSNEEEAKKSNLFDDFYSQI